MQEIEFLKQEKVNMSNEFMAEKRNILQYYQNFIPGMKPYNTNDFMEISSHLQTTALLIKRAEQKAARMPQEKPTHKIKVDPKIQGNDGTSKAGMKQNLSKVVKESNVVVDSPESVNTVNKVNEDDAKEN